jgi:hypothetical protein
VQAACQQFYCSSDSPTDPVAPTQAATSTSRRNIARGIAMDKLDLIDHAEFFSAAFRLLREQRTHVDAVPMIP